MNDIYHIVLASDTVVSSERLSIAESYSVSAINTISSEQVFVLLAGDSDAASISLLEIDFSQR